VLDKLTVEDFLPLVGESFELLAGEATFPAELAWARSVGERPAPESGRRWTFSLAFRTAPDVRLPQRIYGLTHPRLGRLDLFLVPIRPDGGGNLYEAVFN
jgi:hypothetical protein